MSSLRQNFKQGFGLLSPNFRWGISIDILVVYKSGAKIEPFYFNCFFCRRTKWKRKYTNDVELFAQQYYAQLGFGGLSPRPMFVGDRLWYDLIHINFVW